MSIKQKLQLKFAGIVILFVVCAVMAYPQAVKNIPSLYNGINKLNIKLGLDLQGGIHLEYKADTSKLSGTQVDVAMQSLQDVIQRRVNAFGVAEPIIYTTKSGSDRRIVIELAGVKDINQAKDLIKETPLLEFKVEGPTPQPIPQDVLDKENQQAQQKAQDILKKALAGADLSQLAKDNSEDQGSKNNGGDLGFVKKGVFVSEFDKVLFDPAFKDGTVWPELVESQFGWHIIKKIEQRGDGDNLEIHSAHVLIAKKTQPQQQADWVSTDLTGKNLQSAKADFKGGQGLSEPIVLLQFDSEGTKLFDEITKNNIGKPVAMFLDGQIISSPRVNDEIPNGRAEISGSFTVQETQELARKLNAGALPVPIGDPIYQKSVEATLGANSLRSILIAGAIGMAAVIIFMLAFYRFLGLVASLSLLIYTVLMITIFKLTGITLTLSGIAGFVLSIGMAVDANILIFERTKEEIRNGRNIPNSLDEGFKRAWTSIRDGNISSLLTAGILYEMGTGFVRGFAASLFIGVVVSMFTAVVITRTMLKFIIGDWIHGRVWMVGVNKKSIKEERNMYNIISKMSAQG